MTDLTYLLTRLIEDKVPHTRSAVLLSGDGLPKFWHGLAPADAEVLAAIASNLLSTARQVGARFCGGAGVQQVACELTQGILLVTSAGEGSALAVLSDRTVDTGVLSYQMSLLAKQVPEHLATAPRSGGGTVLGPGARP